MDRQNPTDDTNPTFIPGNKYVLSWDSAGNWMINGKSFQFFGGEIHPSRVPSQYWDHRIKMIKALGCNTISLYLMWNFHELPDGAFDFSSSDKNIAHFIDLCATNNMWVLLRPGPYSCAEWDFGGLPPRMLADPQFHDSSDKLQIRGNFPNYMSAVLKWNTALYERVIKGRTLTSGGPIMLIALENEYTSWGPDDPAHPTALAAQWVSLGYTEKFCVCEGWANAFKNNHIPLPTNTAYGLTAEGNSVSHHNEAKQYYQVASFGAECYPGWICHWTEEKQTIYIDTFADIVARLAKAGCSFVIYVGHGGTNFGFTAGSNGKSTSSVPVITSYDYGAPVSENGRQNANFQVIKTAYAKNASYIVPSNPIPASIPSITDGEISPISNSQFVFSDFLSNVIPTIPNPIPQTIEWIALTLNSQQPASTGIYPAGITVYQTELPKSGYDLSVEFNRPPDFALAFLNGVRVTSDVLTTVKGGKISPVTSFKIDDVPPNSILQIVCMSFGRANYGGDEMRTDGRGLSGNVILNGDVLTNWKMTLYPLLASQLAKLPFGINKPTSPRPFFAKAILTIDIPKDMYIDMSSWGTGYVLVNGHNLGRYWTLAGPQTRLYCPGVWLNSGSNTIIIFEFTQATAGTLSFFSSSNLPYNH
ncbi:Beta-galactosidase [Xenorhabdus stockiae]|uniref:Beta-galactosidase n=1 Tax=Xenorhabdus stockiae TaxID=351614 RepID=A0A2D0KS11_9GAMM|nr:beta-galactosidase [Xenorhabdus stockiae]PHM65997.1 Beta-galactosidase [Xenorhabdus stockiae]